MATQTPKAKYTLDAAGQIGVQHPNWDRADQIAGLIYTTKAVGPPADAYEGCVCVEKDTGISYRMVSDGAGGLKKQYINYPFLFYGQYVYGLGLGTWNGVGWNQVGESINFDSSWQDTSNPKGIVIRVKGIYLLDLHCHASPRTYTWNGNIDLGYYINGVLNAKSHVRFPKPGYPYSANAGFAVTELLNVGDILKGYTYNNGVTVCDMNQTIRLSLIRPVV